MNGNVCLTSACLLLPYRALWVPVAPPDLLENPELM